MNSITVFLPLRKGSQRVKNKNFRKFSNVQYGGLTYIKISQLLKADMIDNIIVSTNDDQVKEIANSFNNNKIIIDNRPDHLANEKASTDDLIAYVPSIIDNGIILWTHVTSPFVNANIYEAMIKEYFSKIEEYDSLMSVTNIQKFLWDKNGAMNYDRKKEKWPRTQTITPLFEINSAAFIADISIYKKFRDRIGKKPYLYELSARASFDIDWEDDYEIAEVLWQKYEDL